MQFVVDEYPRVPQVECGVRGEIGGVALSGRDGARNVESVRKYICRMRRGSERSGDAFLADDARYVVSWCVGLLLLIMNDDACRTCLAWRGCFRDCVRFKYRS